VIEKIKTESRKKGWRRNFLEKVEKNNNENESKKGMDNEKIEISQENAAE
jgi:hypothetical protein